MKKLLSFAHRFSAPIKYILAAQGLYGIGLGLFAVLLNLYLKEKGFTEASIGQVLAVQSVCAAGFSIFAGWIADKTSRKATYIMGLVLAVSGYGTLTLSSCFSVAALGAGLFGCGNGAQLVSILPYIQENSINENRSVIFSINSAIIWIMNIAAGFAAGWLPHIAENFEFFSALPQWERYRVILWLGILFFSLAIIPASKMAGKPAVKTEIKKNKEDLSIKNNAGTFKLMAKFSLTKLLTGFGAGLIVPYFNLYFKDWVGASISQIGTVFALGQMGTAVGTLMSPLIAARTGLVKGVVFAQMMSLPFMLIMAFTHNFVLCALCFILRNAFMNMNAPMAQEILMKVIPENFRARASAVYNMSWSLAWALAMSFSGKFINSSGYSSALFAATLCYLVSSLLYRSFFLPLEGKNKEFTAECA